MIRVSFIGILPVSHSKLFSFHVLLFLSYWNISLGNLHLLFHTYQGRIQLCKVFARVSIFVFRLPLSFSWVCVWSWSCPLFWFIWFCLRLECDLASDYTFIPLFVCRNWYTFSFINDLPAGCFGNARSQGLCRYCEYHTDFDECVHFALSSFPVYYPVFLCMVLGQ